MDGENRDEHWKISSWKISHWGRDYIVRSAHGRVLTEAERWQTENALFELLHDYRNRDPKLGRVIQTIHAALFGGFSRFGQDGFQGIGNPDRTEQVARDLEEAVRLGWLTIAPEERPIVRVRRHEPVAPELAPRPEELEPHYTEWIEVELVDEQDRPVPDVLYEITLSNGELRRGRTSSTGLIRYRDIPGGDCQFSLVELDERRWESA